ncbi:MAG: M23 family metallopeptidase [Cyanobacteria bacterium P01_C01_bin.72]
MATNQAQTVALTESRFSNLATSCSQLEIASCFTETKKSYSGIDAELWLREVANSLLPNSSFLDCAQLSLSSSLAKSKLQNEQLSNQPQAFPLASLPNKLALPSLGKTAQVNCGFAWQQRLNRQLMASRTSIATATRLKQDISQGYTARPEFPKLSRTSLIVSFPQENTTFSPQSSKLANPAPETKRIASPFGWRTRPYTNTLQFHQGIDYGAPYGSSVVAVGNGIVTRVVSGCADFGNLFCGGQLGNWIEIDHGNGAIATYGHLKYNSITVKEGMRVRKNQSIAQIGSSGWSTGAHLDFRLKVNGKYENPANYVMAIKPYVAQSTSK